MLFEQVEAARKYLSQYCKNEYKIGMVLGTGLGALAEVIEVESSVPYAQIPNFPVSTVESHAGELIFGLLDGVPVIAMSGRFHYYEGYSAKELSFPIRVLKALGVEKLILSNAAGSTNESIDAGDIVVIRDHINLHPDNPLRGMNDERLGIRFPDMLHTYSKRLRVLCKKAAGALDIKIKEGVYVGLQGPNLETPAEYKFINIIGGDLVGMSTIPEVIVARHSEMEVLAISVVSNKCFPIESLTETTLDEVIEVVNKASDKLIKLVRSILADI